MLASGQRSTEGGPLIPRRRKRPTPDEARERIAKARAADPGVGVQCPKCWVHSPNLRPKRVRYGMSKGPAGGGLTGNTPGLVHPDATASLHRGGSGVMRQYRCPVCGYAWSADPEPPIPGA
jgi:hypothetical protein